MEDLLTIDQRNIWHPFSSLGTEAHHPLISSGSGAHLYTHDGRKIIDAISSWWVNLHGHAHPHIAAAIADQAQRLEHVIFAGFTHEPAIRLTSNLLGILPPDHKKMFFSDNGSTAVEVALKMAIQFWHNRGTPKKKVVALEGAYHGDTFGSMSIGERGLFNKPFFPYLFDVSFVNFPDDDGRALKQLKELFSTGDVGAFIFEPLVQAAGGMRMYPAEMLEQMISLAQKHDVICIADEVFTGFGRTGRYLATDYLASKPDIIALSKGITGGFLPLGVTTCSTRISEAFESAEVEKTFFHGHSYTANPLACAAANASFELLTSEECGKQRQRIAENHEGFAEQVRMHHAVEDARTLGTIIAIELKSDERTSYTNAMRKKIYPWFMERGILMRPLGNVLYLVPPYCIQEADLTYIYDSIREFLANA